MRPTTPTQNDADLCCQLFVDGCADLENLQQTCAALVGGSVHMATVRSPAAELEVYRNPDAGDASLLESDAPFLAFTYTIELEISGERMFEGLVHVVSSLLRGFWRPGWLAVAACSFEDRLPNHGGYHDGELLQPGTVGRKV